MATNPPETKAAAIADLLDGEQPAIVAKRYGLNAATVRSWKARLDLPATGVATPVAARKPEVEAQQYAIGDLVMASLEAKLIAIRKIAEHATTVEWLKKQTGADVAELFTAIDRSATAILDRMASRSRPADPDDDGES